MISFCIFGLVTAALCLVHNRKSCPPALRRSRLGEDPCTLDPLPPRQSQFALLTHSTS